MIMLSDAAEVWSGRCSHDYGSVEGQSVLPTAGVDSGSSSSAFTALCLRERAAQYPGRAHPSKSVLLLHVPE